MVLEIAQHHLEQAAQILALANGTRGLIEKTQPRELRAQLLFVTFTLGDVGGDAEDRVDLPPLIPQRRFDGDVGMQPAFLRYLLFLGDGPVRFGYTDVQTAEGPRGLLIKQL